MKPGELGHALFAELTSSQQLKLVGTFIAVSAILPLMLNFYQQYLAYLALGPGGTPASLTGFLRIKLLEKFTVPNPYETDEVVAQLECSAGYLGDLPVREGSRPVVRGIAPHRQVTQKAGRQLFESLASKIEIMASSSDDFELGTSCFEKHGTGLFSTSPAYRTNHRCKSEICHAHPSDGSMHMTLHPADAKIVLESCWGERHPLSRGGRFERFVPAGFVMVYAPRDEGGVETVMRIVRAAAWFVSGESALTEERKRRDSGYVSADGLVR